MSKYKIGDTVRFVSRKNEESSGKIYDILTDPDEYVIITEDFVTSSDGVIMSVVVVDYYMENKGYVYGLV